MNEKIEEYVNLINLNSTLVEDASNKYGNFPLLSEDESYIQIMIDAGMLESLGTLAAYGGIKVYNDSIYSNMIEKYRQSEEGKSLSNEQFDFLMMYGISSGILDYYKKIEATKSYYTAYYDKNEVEYYGSRNKAGEHGYDEKILSLPASNLEIITTVAEYQKQQTNKISK